MSRPISSSAKLLSSLTRESIRRVTLRGSSLSSAPSCTGSVHLNPSTMEQLINGIDLFNGITNNNPPSRNFVSTNSSPPGGSELSLSNIVREVQLTDHAIIIAWGDGHTSSFHHMWLRDTCQCPACHHPLTTERMLDTNTVSLDVAPTNVKVLARSIQISWLDNEASDNKSPHISEFSLAWLRDHCYSPFTASVTDSVPPTAAPPHSSSSEEFLWTVDDLDGGPPRMSYDSLATDDGLFTWLQTINRYGAVVVEGSPVGEDMAVAMAERVSILKNTFWGGRWSVRSEPNPKNLSLTGAALQPHTDFTWSECPPGLQFLGCRTFRGPAVGGESTLVDGFAAAALLRERDPDVYALLSEVPLQFFFRADDVRFFHEGPVIELDPYHHGHDTTATATAALTGDNGVGCSTASGESSATTSRAVLQRGGVCGLRFNQANRAPLRVRPELVLPMYLAVQRFSQLVRSDEMLLRFRLQEGDVLVFNNRRMLHGREAYDPRVMERHLEGCYIDTEHFDSRLRVLNAQRYGGGGGGMGESTRIV